jgi:hypothetical protein
MVVDVSKGVCALNVVLPDLLFTTISTSSAITTPGNKEVDLDDTEPLP